MMAFLYLHMGKVNFKSTHLSARCLGTQSDGRLNESWALGGVLKNAKETPWTLS
jgi:hypothetical protein